MGVAPKSGSLPERLIRYPKGSNDMAAMSDIGYPLAQ
jgi:hypothetical protein